MTSRSAPELTRPSSLRTMQGYLSRKRLRSRSAHRPASRRTGSSADTARWWLAVALSCLVLGAQAGEPTLRFDTVRQMTRICFYAQGEPCFLQSYQRCPLVRPRTPSCAEADAGSLPWALRDGGGKVSEEEEVSWAPSSSAALPSD